jgi:hypothetical protein
VKQVYERYPDDPSPPCSMPTILESGRLASPETVGGYRLPASLGMVRWSATLKTYRSGSKASLSFLR